MRQHWVPESYLKAWCDPASSGLEQQEPYVWLFSKDGTEVCRKSPKNIFRESNMYTFEGQDGLPNQSIEKWLSKLESKFERLRRDKIMRCEPLTDEDKATLFVFVASAHFRTAANRDHLREQLGAAVEMGDRIEAHIESLSPEEKAALEDFPTPANGPVFSGEDLRRMAGHPLALLPTAARCETELLCNMTISIFCTSDDSNFITSDAPVAWFDPELHRMPAFYRSPGLGSETIEVTMPTVLAQQPAEIHRDAALGQPSLRV